MPRRQPDNRYAALRVGEAQEARGTHPWTAKFQSLRGRTHEEELRSRGDNSERLFPVEG